MVSGGTVRQEGTNVANIFNTYSTETSGLSGSWEGLSYDNMVTITEDFISEFQTTVTEGIESFATACDLYEQYQKTKQEKEEYSSKYYEFKDKYNSASNDEDNSNAGYYKRKRDEYQDLYYEAKEKLEELKQQINENLSAVRQVSGKAAKSISGTSLSLSGINGEGFVTADINGTLGSYLKFDENAVYNVIGRQPFSGPCGIYSKAYGYIILEGKNRIPGDKASINDMYKYYNAGVYSDMTQWPGMTSHKIKGKEKLDLIWDEVVERNKPCVVAVEGSSENHYVCAIGVRQGATKEDFKPSDVIILDPAMPEDQMLCYYGQGYGDDFDGGYTQLVTYDDE